MPEAQKNCHGARTPSSPPRSRSRSSAGIMVRKIPANSTATSTIGPAEKPLSRRMRAGVSLSETAARAHDGQLAPGRAAGRPPPARRPASQTALRPPCTRSGSMSSAVAPEGRRRLPRELHGVEDEEGGEEHGEHQPPVRPQPEGPGERHAGQVAEEQRRIAQRRQHAPDVGHDEDEEDDGVLHARALAVRLQQGPDQQHGGAGGAHEGGQEAAEGEKAGVGERAWPRGRPAAGCRPRSRKARRAGR